MGQARLVALHEAEPLIAPVYERVAAETPGMFGRVRVPGSSPYEALLVPDNAIGSEQIRKYVLVVDGENIARNKYVTLGQLVGNMRVIKDGLSADDRVVVNGLMRARAGSKVTPQEQGAPASPGPQAKN